jgi:hypothetical protein
MIADDVLNYACKVMAVRAVSPGRDTIMDQRGDVQAILESACDERLGDQRLVPISVVDDMVRQELERSRQ